MVLYFLIFILLAFIGFLKTRYELENNLVFPFLLIVLVLFAALRGPYVDKDYQNYIESFTFFLTPAEYFKNMGDWFMFEPLYYLIPSFLKTIDISHYEAVTFFIFASISVSINLFAISRISNFPLLSIITWFSFNYLLHEMTQIRAGVAVALLLVCLYQHYHRNYIGFILTFLLALMFHYTSLLILPILFLRPKSFNIRINFFILGISLILGFLRSDFLISPVFLIDAAFVKKLTATLQAMTEDQNSINFINPVFISQVLITIWLFINHKNLIVNNKYSYLLLKLQLLCIFSMCAFSSIAVIAFRVSEFYGIVTILTMPLLVYTFKQRIIGYSAVVGYALFILFNFVVLQKLVGPYELIFFSDYR